MQDRVTGEDLLEPCSWVSNKVDTGDNAGAHCCLASMLVTGHHDIQKHDVKLAAAAASWQGVFEASSGHNPTAVPEIHLDR